MGHMHHYHQDSAELMDVGSFDQMQGQARKKWQKLSKGLQSLDWLFHCVRFDT